MCALPILRPYRQHNSIQSLFRDYMVTVYQFPFVVVVVIIIIIIIIIIDRSYKVQDYATKFQ